MQWEPSPQQLEQFNQLQYLLREWNQKINLTRLIEGNDFWISQILDSLWPIQDELKFQDKQINIIDVGTGCGLPGLAVAIALPRSSTTLIDSIYRKTSAVKEIVKELGLLSRVNVLTERIELTGQKKLHRHTFDLAIARAVAKAPVLAEYLIPFLKPTGQAVMYKGKWNDLEKKELLKALSKLKGKIDTTKSLELPERRGIRHAIRISSTMLCPGKYPRSVGIPLKRPLNNQTSDNL
ncbi:rRNA small subunit 7-methylguanosine (m7G) methyltransferase GidB [Prochlorococcus sp. SS52]|nr:rRNA small subunit 7-methylguanosine (m7G) methyltransferase GidB [Prochlorococcus sp. SS52]